MVNVKENQPNWTLYDWEVQKSEADKQLVTTHPLQPCKETDTIKFRQLDR